MKRKKRFREVKRLSEFDRDLKKLSRKYRTLEGDLNTFISTQLYLYHKLKKDNRGTFPIDDLGFSEINIFKAKKFACRSLKGKGVKSGIRIIYTYLEEKDRIELIEIYSKTNKEAEDRNRINSYYKNA